MPFLALVEKETSNRMRVSAEEFFSDIDSLRSIAESTRDEMMRERSQESMRIQSIGQSKWLHLSLSGKTYEDAYFPYHIAHCNQATWLEYYWKARDTISGCLNVLFGRMTDEDFLEFHRMYNVMYEFFFVASIPSNGLCEENIFPHGMALAQYIYHREKFDNILYYNGPEGLPSFAEYGENEREKESDVANYLAVYHPALYDEYLKMKMARVTGECDTKLFDVVSEGDSILYYHRKSGNLTWYLPFLRNEEREKEWKKYETEKLPMLARSSGRTA